MNASQDAGFSLQAGLAFTLVSEVGALLVPYIGDVEYMTVIMLTNSDAHTCTIWRFGRHETRGLTVYGATASTLEQAKEQAANYLRSLRNGSES